MIRISPIRLIDENNEQVGVVETSEALRRAEQAGLDLVEVSPEARPPVCKIMDYGKYKYEQSKKEQRSRQASKQAEMKEVRLGRSIKIDPHDVQIRVERARRFLIDGHKVLLVQQFRGREMLHKSQGYELLNNVVEQLDDISKVETPPRAAGRRVTMILAPDKNKIARIKQQKKQTNEPDVDQPQNERDAGQRTDENSNENDQAGEPNDEAKRQTPVPSSSSASSQE